jgi:hypothetical protein
MQHTRRGPRAIGAEIVAKAPPDGYNILVTTASLSVNAGLHR